MLKPGDRIESFVVNTIDGMSVNYDTIWQRRNLLAVTLPRHAPLDISTAYARALAERQRELAAHDAVCVVTFDAIPHMPCPGVAIADRWGEVYFVSTVSTVEELPLPDTIMECVRFVDHECPECQGEAR